MVGFESDMRQRKAFYVERIGTLLRRLKLDPVNLRAAALASASARKEAARPCMGEDEPPVAPQDVAHRLSGVGGHDASNTGMGKDRSPKAPAKFGRNNNETPRQRGPIGEKPSPLSRPALHVLSGGRELGTVQRRNGFPRPAVPNSLLLVVDHASSRT